MMEANIVVTTLSRREVGMMWIKTLFFLMFTRKVPKVVGTEGGDGSSEEEVVFGDGDSGAREDGEEANISFVPSEGQAEEHCCAFGDQVSSDKHSHLGGSVLGVV